MDSEKINDRFAELEERAGEIDGDTRLTITYTQPHEDGPYDVKVIGTRMWIAEDVTGREMVTLCADAGIEPQPSHFIPVELVTALDLADD